MLRCERICKSFDGVRAATDVSVDFDLKGVAAIVGPNGAGKTTLLNLLTGFLRPDSGQVWFGDREITRHPPFRIAQLGISRSFQEIRLIRRLSVLENILLAHTAQEGESLAGALLATNATRAQSALREEAVRLLSLVGLQDKAGDPAGEISYGQQKLLTIACCLATGGRVLLLDEPVAGVHPGLASRILGLLRKLGEEDHLIVFIEHDLAAVKEIADRVIVMDEGRIIADGEPAAVFQRPDVMEAYVA